MKLMTLRNFKTLSLPMISAFLLLTAINTQDGGQNARTRISTMRAMNEQFTFRIDSYINASNDWSRTPDGAYYSNKAPGPMLYGFPVFFVLDRLHMLKEHGYRDERGLRHYPDYMQMTGTSLLMQAVPFALLGAYVVHLLAGLGVSIFAQGLVLFALLFGNTAAVYMSSYFGHGMTAVFILAALIALIERRFALFSFCFSSALLCDYGVGMQIPAVLLSLCFVRDKKIKPLLKGLVIGAIIPGVLWIWYHTVTFGNPFYIANKFQNPVFLDMQQETVQLWGIFSLPRFDVLWKLLAGPERGILYTQPWVLAMAPFGLWSAWKGKYKEVSAYCLVGLVGLLFMNMSFGGWNGGGAAGPRYLCHIFPAFALWLGLIFDRIPKSGKILICVTVFAAVLFRSLVYSSTTEAPAISLWGFYIGELGKKSWTPIFRVFLFWVILTAAWLFKNRMAVNAKRV
jgi:hypothetical protein